MDVIALFSPACWWQPIADRALRRLLVALLDEAPDLGATPIPAAPVGLAPEPLGVGELPLGWDKLTVTFATFVAFLLAWFVQNYVASSSSSSSSASNSSSSSCAPYCGPTDGAPPSPEGPSPPWPPPAPVRSFADVSAPFGVQSLAGAGDLRRHLQARLDAHPPPEATLAAWRRALRAILRSLLGFLPPWAKKMVRRASLRISARRCTIWLP